MKVITPITITDDNMTSSIAEPDTSVGEEVWVDPSELDTFGSHSDNYYASTLGDDGDIYVTGNVDSVLVVDTDLESLSTISITGTGLNQYRASAKSDDGNIYCIGLSSTVYGKHYEN